MDWMQYNFCQKSHQTFEAPDLRNVWYRISMQPGEFLLNTMPDNKTKGWDIVYSVDVPKYKAYNQSFNSILPCFFTTQRIMIQLWETSIWGLLLRSSKKLSCFRHDELRYKCSTCFDAVREKYSWVQLLITKQKNEILCIRKWQYTKLTIDRSILSPHVLS